MTGQDPSRLCTGSQKDRQSLSTEFSRESLSNFLWWKDMAHLIFITVIFLGCSWWGEGRKKGKEEELGVGGWRLDED